MRALQEQIDHFLTELSSRHRLSPNTADAYRRDLRLYLRFLHETCGIRSWSEVTELVLMRYLYRLRDQKRSTATIARKMVSIRSFHHYLTRHRLQSTDPSVSVRAPKTPRRAADILTVTEIDRMIDAAAGEGPEAIRDRAMLEMLYATGMRVSELVGLMLDDLNLTLGFVRCRGTRGKERIVPIGAPAREAAERYITAVRRAEPGEQHVFLNVRKRGLTRQGVWKIIKKYATKANIERPLSPETIRQSLTAHLLERGADAESVEELMGRSTPPLYERFPNRMKPRLQDVYAHCHPRAGKKK
jgi:integrase/recombinase XerD